MSSQCNDLDAPDFIPVPFQSKSSISMSLERSGESLGLWSWEEPQFELNSETNPGWVRFLSYGLPKHPKLPHLEHITFYHETPEEH